jgi:hypothetical protein
MTPSAALLVALLSQTVGAPGVAPPPSPTKLRLEVRAPGACTSQSDLAARIAARSPRIEVVNAAPLSAQVTVSAARPGNVVADLVLASPGVESTERRVVARSCAEAADGAALIIAVTLDPSLPRNRTPDRARESPPTNSDGAASRPAPGTPPAPAPGGETANAPATRPTVEPQAPPAAARGAAPVAASAEARPPGVPSAARRRELGAALAGQTVFGAAPSVMPGVALYVTAALDRDGVWAPAVFLGAMHVWRSDLAPTGAAASFTFDAASVDLCPLRLRWSLLAVRPCGSVLVGRLAAQGSHVTQAASVARLFGAAGAALSASFGSRLQLWARLGVGATLIRNSYEFGNDVFFRAAPLTISASLGIGRSWP